MSVENEHAGYFLKISIGINESLMDEVEEGMVIDI